MYTVDLPLTDDEREALEEMAESAGADVGELVAVFIRDELEGQRHPLTPNLG